MARLRLRTQLLIATLLIICGLLGALLLIVRHTVRSEIVEGARQSTDASLHAFENVQRERELELSRTAAILAELPTLKAVMATQHALTIQDASNPFWKLAGSQLFVLSSTDGQVLAFHVSEPGWQSSFAEAELKKSVAQGDDAAWWFGNGQLYRVFLRPILAGSEDNQRQLGIIAVGYQIDSTRGPGIVTSIGKPDCAGHGRSNHRVHSSPTAAATTATRGAFGVGSTPGLPRNRAGRRSLPGGHRVDIQGPSSQREVLRADVPAARQRFPFSAKSHHSDSGTFRDASGGIASELRVAHHHASARRTACRRASAGAGRLRLHHKSTWKQRSGGTGRHLFQNARRTVALRTTPVRERADRRIRPSCELHISRSAPLSCGCGSQRGISVRSGKVEAQP